MSVQAHAQTKEKGSTVASLLAQNGTFFAYIFGIAAADMTIQEEAIYRVKLLWHQRSLLRP